MHLIYNIGQMHNYALREYWNPTVHSPSTVKNYFYNHKTILEKENIPSLLTTFL
jgi:hypothetical protein